MRAPLAGMRPSGVAWVGDIPAHWDVRPLRAVADERDERNEGMIEDNLLSLSFGRIVPKDINANDGLLPESFETYQIVEAGDVVLRLTDLQNDKRSLRSGLVSERGIITSAYTALKPTAIAPAYLGYLLRAYDITKAFYSMGGGLRQSLKYRDMRQLPIIMPPAEEQTSIAAFLDRETHKIDTLVEEQRRLIDLLKEKRQAVISHAVTKGLDPNARMKPSSIEWLGYVPEHWDVMPLKFMVSHVVDCLHTTPTYDGELQYPAVRTADIERGVLLLEQARLVSEEVYLERIQRLKPEASDILYSREGERFGMAALVPPATNLCLGQRMMMFRSKPPNVPGYLMWTLNSEPIYQQVVARTAGATAPHANIGDVINFRLPCPDEHEQLAIAEYLDATTGDIDELVAEAEAAVGLLHERRAALISAAVTGKIEVRGVVAADEVAA